MSTLVTLAITSFLGFATAVALCVLLFAPTSYDAYSSDLPDPNEKSASKVATTVQVVVLGDIGRSPRMQNHAISLIKHGARVHLIGFVESDIHPELQKSKYLTLFPLSPFPKYLQTSSKILFTVLAPLKVAWQAFDLARALAYKSGPSRWMLVQNPPSIPTLAIARIICITRNSRLVIDWHNTGWSMLSLKLGERHPLVKVAEFYERAFSRNAYQHFAVSSAMSTWLGNELQISALPLHDRPMTQFQPLTSDQRVEVLQTLQETASYAADIISGTWRLVVSSTSWTNDEDFSILLDALVGYSTMVARDKSLPRVRAVITGKGPGREHYLQKIGLLNQENRLSNVTITTGWFSFKDYISLLGASDLGVSLHMSSSGLDLPMKVVDMFGAGLPVVGYCGYPSWPELVEEGVNGRGFLNAQDLTDLFFDLFTNDGKQLEILKDGALKERTHGWDEEWNATAGEKVFFPQMSKGQPSELIEAGEN